MENHLLRIEHKWATIIQHIPTGLAEIDNDGRIIHLNTKGKSLLKPVWASGDFDTDNLYPVLAQIAPSVAQIIKTTADDAGQVLANEPHSFFISFGHEKIERHFRFSVNKLYTDCIIVGFDDFTLINQEERAIRQLNSEKALMQGKFEIASNILHDIGNAVVGLGSHISRIKRSMENNNAENLQKLTNFFETHKAGLDTAFGEVKAEASLKMLNGITHTQMSIQEDAARSITEQLHLITHIQDILNIQRQYANGQESQERKPVNLRAIITDCMSMLFASVEKRGIKVSVNIPESLPAINGDRTRLMQVILNLIKNSIEAIDIDAEEKTISLDITIQNGQLIFKTKDSGHGFDGVTAKQLFKRGFTTKASGSGIGLYSCREIIEKHEGSIEMTSEGYGLGTLATIKFKI
jgi:signal transduction histidine kinase